MLAYVLAWLSQFDREEEGQGLVEYGLVIILVSIAAVATLAILGTKVSGLFTTIANAI
jgi:pilus assembly protein Flp/PilA